MAGPDSRTQGLVLVAGPIPEPSLDELLAPAIAYAGSGFPVSPVIGRAWNAAEERLLADPGASTTFLIDRRAPKIGEIIRNPDLATSLRAICADVPLDRLLVETDAPYLAPQPHRGKRNEPAYVVETARVLAEVKNTTPAAMADTTSENFFRLFSNFRFCR